MRPEVALANGWLCEGRAPAGAWLPTELGEEVINALLKAGAGFED